MDQGRAVSKEKPELITKAAVHAVKSLQKIKQNYLCGAGIVSGEDVAKSIELGSKGILVASGIIKAKKLGITVMSELCQINGLNTP